MLPCPYLGRFWGRKGGNIIEVRMDIKSGIINKNSFIGSNPLNVNNKVLAEYIYISVCKRKS